MRDASGESQYLAQLYCSEPFVSNPIDTCTALQVSMAGSLGSPWQGANSGVESRTPGRAGSEKLKAAVNSVLYEHGESRWFLAMPTHGE